VLARRIAETAPSNNAAAIAQSRIEWWLILPHPLVKSFRRPQFAFEPTECGVLLHGIKLVATLASDPSRRLAWRPDKLQLRAAPWTPSIYDLSHADILADRREVSILNAVVLIEYSTLEGATSLRRIRE
jgi:hypothetical protein